jgi:hypothetical protein
MQQSRTKWRPRFRLVTLFWLTAIVAAFFVGRRSDQIKSVAVRWWQVTRVRFGGDVNSEYYVVNWPPGSLTINENVPIHAVVNNYPNSIDVKLIGSRQLQISPKTFGEMSVSYTTPGNTYKSRQLRLKVEPDQKCPDWTLDQQ